MKKVKKIILIVFGSLVAVFITIFMWQSTLLPNFVCLISNGRSVEATEYEEYDENLGFEVGYLGLRCNENEFMIVKKVFTMSEQKACCVRYKR